MDTLQSRDSTMTAATQPAITWRGGKGAESRGGVRLGGAGSEASPGEAGGVSAASPCGPFSERVVAPQSAHSMVRKYGTRNATAHILRSVISPRWVAVCRSIPVLRDEIRSIRMNTPTYTALNIDAVIRKPRQSCRVLNFLVIHVCGIR